MDKKTVLISQVLMTGMMAASMSGLMSLIAMGPSWHWASIWMKQFALAWPIAFVMTMICWPLATGLTARIVKAKG